MHPIVKRVFDKEYARVQELRYALKKAFDILGNIYAPLFFCAACLMGIALPVFAWKTGGVLNALLGARGVGTITSELSQGMWVMVVALAVFFGAHLLLSRLEGKMHDVFMTLARICEMSALLIYTTTYFGVFVTSVLLFIAWRIFEHVRVRGSIATIWFFGLTWMFFSLATDVALRVSTVGDMVSILAVCVLFYYATTRSFFRKT